MNLANRGLQLTRGARALEGVAVAQVFGVERVPTGDRPVARPGRVRAGVDRAERDARDGHARCPRSADVPTAVPGDRTTRTRWNAATCGSIRSWPRAVWVYCRRPACAGRTCPFLRDESHERGRTCCRSSTGSIGRRMSLAGIPDPAPRRPERASETGDAVSRGWPAPSMDPDGLAAIPLFDTLTDDRCGSLLAVSRELRVAPGEVVIREWEYGKLFYVILEGAMEVVSGDRVIAVPPGGGLLRRERRPRLGCRIQLRANRVRPREGAFQAPRDPRRRAGRTPQDRGRRRAPFARRDPGAVG